MRIQLFSSRTRKLGKTITRFDDITHGSDIRADGRLLAVGDESGSIQVFETSSRAILKTWKEHNQPVWSVKFSPTEATTLISCSDDKTVRLWDLSTQESVTTFRGHNDYVRSVGFMPGQATGLLVSGSYDETVRIWDPRIPTSPVLTFKHSAPVENVLPMPSGTTILSAADNRITVLDIVGGKPLHVIRNHQKTVTSLCLASRDTRLVSGGLDGHVKIYETTGWNVVAGSKYSSPVLAVSVLSSGVGREDKHLVVGMQSGVLSIKTRLSGLQKAKEKERQKEMKALLEGKLEEHDKKKSRKELSGVKKALRGRDFTGEGADIIIEGNPRTTTKKLQPWEKSLRSAKYAQALDQVLATQDLTNIVTVLVALRHRSAMRDALSRRDPESLQPILDWVRKHIVDPRHVSICVEVGIVLLELYSGFVGQSKQVDSSIKRLHIEVRKEVDRAQQAWQTQGMLGLLMMES